MWSAIHTAGPALIISSWYAAELPVVGLEHTRKLSANHASWKFSGAISTSVKPGEHAPAGDGESWILAGAFDCAPLFDFCGDPPPHETQTNIAAKATNVRRKKRLLNTVLFLTSWGGAFCL